MSDPTIDRGDDFTPTGPDVDAEAAATAAAAAAAAEAEAKAAADKLAADEAAAAEAAAAADKGEEGEGGEKPGAKPKVDSRIPLSRHKEILEKERATRTDLERQLAQYQQGKVVADINADITTAETKILGLEKDYAKLITDGEAEKAAAVMTEIRRTEREMSEAKSDMKIQAAEARATERARYNISLERVESAFPQLNPDHDDFDAELLTDVADLKTTYERKGMTPTDALQKAVKKVVGTETAKQEAATEVKPQVDTKAIAAERKKEAVAKTLDAMAKTPPSTGGVGFDSDKAGGSISAKDVLKMNFKDFSALPEETLARMRGDEL